MQTIMSYSIFMIKFFILSVWCAIRKLVFSCSFVHEDCSKCCLRSRRSTRFTRVIPKVSGLDILDSNIFHNLYISETYLLYGL